MSEPKPGDRVEVRYEGVFTGSAGAIGCWVHEASRSYVVPKSATVTVLARPAAVGDLISTVEEADRLPVGAVLVPEDTTCTVIERSSAGFEFGGGFCSHLLPDQLPARLVALRGADK